MVVGAGVSVEIAATQSDQDGRVSNNWKPDIRTRGDTQEVGDKVASQL